MRALQDEALARKIAEALGKVIEGSPAAWSQLMNEALYRGYARVCASVVLLAIAACSVAWLWRQAKKEVIEAEGAIAISVAVITAVTLLLPVPILLADGVNIVCGPALYLISILKG